MIEYILITALASFINIYTVTAVSDANVQLQEPKIGFVTVSDVGESTMGSNDISNSVF
jgi:hypothetical protein